MAYIIRSTYRDDDVEAHLSRERNTRTLSTSIDDSTEETRRVEHARFFRPSGLGGVEALHATFVEHAYRPHSHATWTIAVMEAGAAQFSVESSHERADAGELFVLEPDAVHTGMAAVPEGWSYKVLYLEPELVGAWAEGGMSIPRASRWVVFRDRTLRDRLLKAQAAFAADESGIALEVPVAEAVAGLRPHLRPFPEAHRRDRAEHAAVRRAVSLLRERWNESVDLDELSRAAGLSRFELVRRFRKQVGLPPHAFQLDLRVAAARRLLAGGRPAVQVAFMCGFADQPHLTRVLKRAVGVTPGEYARAG
jgi:AraC-like DNA-binding protein